MPEVAEPTVTFSDEQGNDDNTEVLASVWTTEKPGEEGKSNEEAPAEDKPAEDKPAEENKPAEAEKPVEENKETPAPAPVITPDPARTAPPAERPTAVADPLEAIGITKDNTLGRKLVEVLAKGGMEDVQSFLKVFGTDWDKVPHLDVIRQDLMEQYKNLEPKKRDFMVNREMAKYNIDDTFDEDAKMAAEIEAEIKANKIRDGYKAEQSAYKAPDRNQPDPAEVQRQQQAQQDAAEFEKRILSDPFLAEFETNKSVKLGEGDTAFNFATPEIDLKAALAVPFDEHFITRDKDGKATGIKLREYATALAFAKNGDKILKELAKHYMEQGEKARDAKLRNIGRPKEAAAPSGDVSSVQWVG